MKATKNFGQPMSKNCENAVTHQFTASFSTAFLECDHSSVQFLNLSAKLCSLVFLAGRLSFSTNCKVWLIILFLNFSRRPMTPSAKSELIFAAFLESDDVAVQSVKFASSFSSLIFLGGR